MLTNTISRSTCSRLVLAAVALTAHARAAAQPQALSEADVVRLAKLRDPEAQLAGAQAAASAADEVEAGLYPNPALAWTREHVPGSGPLAEREDSFVLSVPIELSGRRGAQRALARSQTAADAALAARARSAAVVRALSHFYAALAAQRRVEIARDAAARLDEAARVLARRFEQGTASGYERLRIELEAELGGSELRQAQAHASAELNELAGWLGLDPPLELRGDLELSANAAAARRHDGPHAPRSLALAREAVAEARRAQDSAGSAWLPALEASGGVRMTGAQDETDYGYVAGLAIDLPITTRGQDVRAQAGARARLATAQADALERGARLQAERAAAELEAAQGELARFSAGTGERVQQLERAAQSAYREGQQSVLELLDAQRARTAVELRKLELALAAKHAELALRAARGELE